MGNLFFSSSSKKSHHGSVKRGAKAELQTSTYRESHHDHNDNRSSGGKLKQSNSCSYPGYHQEHGSETIHGDRPENVSPFQRDYPAPHQMLVPLEKYRPRRSNIRRSARQPNNPKCGSGTNDQLVLPSDNHKVPVINHNSFDEPPEKNQKLVEEPAIDYEDEEVKTNVILEKSNENDEDDNETTSQIDDLDPSERNKLARTKLAELLRKQKQVMPVMTNNHQKKYQNELNSEHSNPTDDPECSPENRKSFEVEDKIPEEDAEDGGGEEILVRRPRKPLLTHGNAMLIDELKKRQSNLYDPARKLSPTSVSGHHQPPPPALITTVESN